MPWLNIIIFLFSCAILIKASAWVVKSLVRIAQALRWSEFTVAFILMAFVTSVPELFIGITSALHNRPDLSFGNVIGSNIINLTLIVGIVVLLASGLSLEKVVAKKDSLWTALFASLPVLMILDGSLSRADGIALLIGLVIYLSMLFKQRIRVTKILNSELRAIGQFKSFLKDIGLFFGGLVLILLSAEGIVWSSSALAELIGIPLVLVGILIVALGTNLPEIIFGVRAVLSKHKEMVLGNLMGSVVINSTLVLGLTVLIHPFQVKDFSPLLSGIFFTILAAFLFYIFARTKDKISKKEGVILLLVYAAFVTTQILLR